jgi:hypothetical protein
MDKVFEVVDGFRVRVEQDDFGFTLAELIGDDVGVQSIMIADRFAPIRTNDEVADVVERVVESFNYYSHQFSYQAKRERVLGAWLEASGYLYKFVTLRGYSKGEWADVVVYVKDDYETSAEHLTNTVQTVRAWFRGDVYRFILEEAKIFTADDGEQLTEWREVESCGGWVSSDDEQLHEWALEFARENI